MLFGKAGLVVVASYGTEDVQLVSLAGLSGSSQFAARPAYVS